MFFHINKYIIFIFENGTGVKVPVSAYDTKGTRRKLQGAYSAASPIVAIFYEKEPFEIMMTSSANKAIIFKSSLIPIKSTRSAGGVTLMTLKKDQTIFSAISDENGKFEDTKGYRKLKLPAIGTTI